MRRVRRATCAAGLAALASVGVVTAPTSADGLLLCAGRIATITGTAKAETITGTSGNDVIVGLGGNDIIHGLDGDDRICGNDGDDTILPGQGNDTVRGDGGINRVSYAGINGLGVTINLATGTASGAGSDTFTGFVNATGSGGPDEIFASSAVNNINGGPSGDFVNYSQSSEVILAMFLGDGATIVDLPSHDDVIVSIENAVGTEGDDIIQGDDGINRILGRGGDDVIRAAGGDDTIFGEAGNDELTPGTGEDTVIGGEGDDLAIYQSSTTPVAVDLAAGTAVVGGVTDELLQIEGATGGSGNDTLNGSAGPDTFFGLGGSDTIRGFGGNDFLNPGSGDDTVLGGSGIDDASYADVSTPITATLGVTCEATGAGTDSFGFNTRTGCDIENLIGGTGNDVLTGDGRSNFLNGFNGNDTLNGEGSSDTLRPGLGNDTVRGGTGVDRVDYTRTNIGITANLRTGTATGEGTDTYGAGGVNDVENFLGGGGADVVVPSAATNALDGNGGPDTVDYGPLTTAVIVDLDAGTVLGGGGSDTLVEFERASGGSGNDRFVGTADNNVFTGRAGIDVVDYTSEISPVNVSLPQKRATGLTIGTDTLNEIEGATGGFAGDTLIGTPGPVGELLNGGPGGDTIDGGGHAAPTATNHDVLGGGSGNDTIKVALRAELVDGGANADTLDLAAAAEGVSAALDATGGGTATGAAGTTVFTTIEHLVGTPHDDILTGNDDANVIAGGAGDDVVTGNGGDDTLDGGPDTDTASFASAPAGVSATLGEPGVVTNPTGHGTDSMIDFEALVGSDQADTLTGNSLDNVIEGGNGNDVLEGAGGVDTASFESATDAVTANLATGVANGAGADTIAGFESLRGGTANDTLIGNAADNTLDGGPGDDTLRGAAGSDTVSYANSTTGVNANLTTAAATGDGTDAFVSIENLEGSAAADTLIGNGSANRIRGDLADTCQAGGGSDAVVDCGFLKGQLAAGQVDTYEWSFAAASGTLRLDQFDTLASTPLVWTLTDPAATTVFFRETVAIDSQAVPIVAGTYRLTVEGLTPTSSGSHFFNLVAG